MRAKTALIPLILLILITPALAECEQYIKNAKQYENSDMDTHTKDYAIAQEYEHAAKCYEEKQETQLSNQYYSLAAISFVSAAKTIPPGADISLKAQAYESAADSYLKIAEYSKAETYYDKAIDTYGSEYKLDKASVAERAGDSFANLDRYVAEKYYDQAQKIYQIDLEDQAKANVIMTKIHNLEQQSTSSPDNSLVLVFWVTLLIVLIIILITVILSATSSKGIKAPKIKKSKPSRVHTPLPKKPESKPKTIHQRPTGPKPKPKPEPPKRPHPRQRALEKLRKKYMPK